MEFCCKCGILLGLDWVLDKDSFCKPCFEYSNAVLDATCECEICGFRDEDSTQLPKDCPDITPDSPNIHLDPNPLPQTQRKQKKRKRHRNQTVWRPLELSLPKQRVDSSFYPSDQNFARSDFDWGSANSPAFIDEQNSPDNVKAEGWPVYDQDADLLEDWANIDINSEYNQFDPNWDSTVLVASSTSKNMGNSSSISTKSKTKSSEKNDEKDPKHTIDSGRKQYYLVEEVREKWEREQKDYRLQQVDVDTPEISALVAGQRRKIDGSRYFVGGVDISFIKGNKEDACACLSVLRMPDLELVYQRLEMVKLTQPYIPGFLAFREVPALEPLFGHLKAVAPQYWPDITLVDGNGKLHPRSFGLACHLGVVLDIPTMGVAKSLISAQGICEDQEHKKMKKTLSGAGEGFDLVSDAGEVLGKCVRVHDSAPNPMYVSTGHKVSLASAVWLALECSKFRIPEPVRRADLDSREYLRQGKTEPEEFVLR